MGSNNVTLDDIIIRRVTSINESKIEEILDVYIKTYWDDIFRGPIVRKENGCGRYMAKGMFLTAVMNGLAFVAEHKDDGRVLAGIGFFKPGKERIFGSEEEQKLSGYKTMHELMTDEENALWDEQMEIWFSIIDKGILSSIEHGYPIMQLFVSPEVQKRGIGTRLVRESLKLIIDSNDPDAYAFLGAYTPKAIRLYEHLGFKITASAEIPLELVRTDGGPRKSFLGTIMTKPRSKMLEEDT
ncbi:hypothetical protein Clacol_000755 [Clathrus columnatus]|uniref:N-acetyltransferase domain-containing protein n=1 Tax=Clathrus columnatus TaxID=1419009 RepID=A0AAV4ZZ72_9AGAM|nr:hypothetical protein Clacol_000755 [Clathrus columnatus]